MPYVDSAGVSIHYHVEGDGPPLVLQHGLTSSLRNWYAYGFVEELQKDYRVIMVDARGHGRSGKPHDPKDYDLIALAMQEPQYRLSGVRQLLDGVAT